MSPAFYLIAYTNTHNYAFGINKCLSILILKFTKVHRTDDDD